MIRSARLAIHLDSPELTRFVAKPPLSLSSSSAIYFAGIPPILRINSQNFFSNFRSSLSTSPTSGDRHRKPETLSSMEIDGKPSAESEAPVADDSVDVRSSDAPEISSVDESGRSSGSDTSGNPCSEDFVQSDVRASDGELRGSENEEYEDGDVGEEEKKVLPEDLLKDVVMLSCESSVDGGSCDVYLVGTAHVSQESCREVQAVISYLKPQVVFLELCSSRVAILTPQNLQVPTMRQMIDSWKKKNSNMFGILYSYFLAKVAHKLEVFPGSEFRVAFEEARTYGGKVILGDRPVQITLRRTWGKMPLWHKVKFLYSMLFQAIFLPEPDDLNKMLKEMDNVDMLTLVIQEMSKAFPTLMETLVYERDLYMSSTLLRVAQEHTSVVAVVGKGHLQGIKKHWKQPVVVKDLLEIPTKKSGPSAARIFTTLGVAVAGAAIISGFFIGGKR